MWIRHYKLLFIFNWALQLVKEVAIKTSFLYNHIAQNKICRRYSDCGPQKTPMVLLLEKMEK